MVRQQTPEDPVAPNGTCRVVFEFFPTMHQPEALMEMIWADALEQLGVPVTQLGLSHLVYVDTGLCSLQP